MEKPSAIAYLLALLLFKFTYFYSVDVWTKCRESDSVPPALPRSGFALACLCGGGGRAADSGSGSVAANVVVDSDLV